MKHLIDKYEVIDKINVLLMSCDNPHSDEAKLLVQLKQQINAVEPQIMNEENKKYHWNQIINSAMDEDPQFSFSYFSELMDDFFVKQNIIRFEPVAKRTKERTNSISLTDKELCQLNDYLLGGYFDDITVRHSVSKKIEKADEEMHMKTMTPEMKLEIEQLLKHKGNGKENVKQL